MKYVQKAFCYYLEGVLIVRQNIEVRVLEKAIGWKQNTNYVPTL